MVKRFYKHKLLLDENMPPRTSLPRLNEHFDVKHVDHDLRRGSIDDQQVQTLALSQGRIIITLNIKHFRPMAGRNRDADLGVIGIPPHWQPSQVDVKLTSLLMQHGANYFRGRYISLSA
ncbi:DUF5615 family PIN-like protein [Streptomyces asiaticus]|uniref:DUF5615 family PIN-like protein n=1 Tax=Streptomyces asiaticus TaxID=114695 RepID=UPI0033D8C7B1